MTVMTAVLGLALILGVLYEAFETMLLPRRVARSFRLTRLFYIHSWRLWTAMAGSDRAGPAGAGRSSATSAPSRCWSCSASGRSA